MAKKEPTTEELRRVQHERTTDEHLAIDKSVTEDEAHQHERRADKAAYLAEKLAERERAERRAERAERRAEREDDS
ncbi:MAG: signal recognition particle-docking protein FtsY, partial [Solirubrobacterales bacterium]